MVEECEDPTESTNLIYLNQKTRDGNAQHESLIIVKSVSAKDLTDSIGVAVWASITTLAENRGLTPCGESAGTR